MTDRSAATLRLTQNQNSWTGASSSIGLNSDTLTLFYQWPLSNRPLGDRPLGNRMEVD